MRQGAELVAGSGAVAAPLRIAGRRLLDQALDGRGNVIDIGEIATHVAVVEKLDRLARGDRLGENPHGHVGTAPRPVDGEETQAGHRDA